MLLTIILFIVILSILIFVHEFGHFIAARRAGVKVEEFGFGFPPRIVGIKWKGTIYSLNWIPLGGFVKIKGETGEHGEDKDSFAHKPIWQRGIILSAGVAMNVVLAIVIFCFGFAVGLPQAINEHLPSHARVRDKKIQIIWVLKDSPAEQAGIQLGDTIVAIDGKSFSQLDQVQDYIDQKQNQEISLRLKRVKKEIEVTALAQAPEKVTENLELLKELKDRKAILGVNLTKTAVVSYPSLFAIANGVKAGFLLIGQIVLAVGRLFKDLILARGVSGEVTGPIGIAVLTGQVARLGFIYVLQFIALLSLNLAVINFLPFPALDGGRVLFLGIEAVRGRPNDVRIENLVHNIGFALLICLVLAITYRDIVRFGGRIVDVFKRAVGG